MVGIEFVCGSDVVLVVLAVVVLIVLVVVVQKMVYFHERKFVQLWGL
ncbi:hypothetical protein A2U01_0085021, partial [Trifolium medium]|nr:hypothetical protein [Trifolium medium]